MLQNFNFSVSLEKWMKLFEKQYMEMVPFIGFSYFSKHAEISDNSKTKFPFRRR